MERDDFLAKMVAHRQNGLIKVITGIRRCGKSYLVFNLFYNYLLESGVAADRIISLALDDDAFAELRHPVRLGEYIRQRISSKKEQFYVSLTKSNTATG